MVTTCNAALAPTGGKTSEDPVRSDLFLKLIHHYKEHCQEMAAKHRCEDPNWRPPSEMHARYFLLKCYEYLSEQAEKKAEEVQKRYGYDPRTHASVLSEQYDFPIGFYSYIGLAALQAFTLRKIQAAQQSRQSYMEASMTFNRNVLPLYIHAYRDSLCRQHLISLRSYIPQPKRIQQGFVFMTGWIASHIKRYPELMRAIQQAHPSLSYDDGVLLELPGEAVQLAEPYLNHEIAFQKLPGLAAASIQNRYYVSPLEMLTDKLPPIDRFPDPEQTLQARADIETYWPHFSPQQRAIVCLKSQDYERAEIADLLSTTDATVKEQLGRLRQKARKLRAEYS